LQLGKEIWGYSMSGETPIEQVSKLMIMAGSIMYLAVAKEEKSREKGRTNKSLTEDKTERFRRIQLGWRLQSKASRNHGWLIASSSNVE
jgi:hypothetical protein